MIRRLPRLLLDKNSNLPRTWTTPLRVLHYGINIRIVLESSEYRSAQRRFIGTPRTVRIRVSPYDFVAEFVHEYLFLSLSRHPGRVDRHRNFFQSILAISNLLELHLAPITRCVFTQDDQPGESIQLFI